MIDIVERLRAPSMAEACPDVDPKANYRTRPISLFEEAAAEIESLGAAGPALTVAQQTAMDELRNAVHKMISHHWDVGVELPDFHPARGLALAWRNAVQAFHQPGCRE